MIGKVVVLSFLGYFLLGGGLGSLGRAEQEGQNTLAKLTEEAKKEGHFVIYQSPVVPDIKAVLDSFTKKYPFIKGEQYRAGSVSLINRVLMESKAKAGKWDVLIINSMFLEQLKRKDLLLNYPSAERSGYGKGFRDEEGFWNGIFINTQVVAYNTKLVAPKDVPKSFMDLLDPKWRGKIAMDSEPYEWLAGLEKQWGKEKAWDYLKKLGQQKVTLRQGRTLITQLCSAGEFPLILPIYGYEAERIKRQGAPVNWVPLDPVIANQLGIGMAKTASNPNTAKLFIDFALSKEGQTVLRDVGRIPARLEVKPNPPTLTEGIKIIPSDPNLGDEVSRVLKEFNANFKK